MHNAVLARSIPARGMESPQRSSLDLNSPQHVVSAASSFHGRVAVSKALAARPRSASSTPEDVFRTGSAPSGNWPQHSRSDSQSSGTSFKGGSDGVDGRGDTAARVLRPPPPKALAVGFSCPASGTAENAEQPVSPRTTPRNAGMLHRSLNENVFVELLDGAELEVHAPLRVKVNIGPITANVALRKLCTCHMHSHVLTRALTYS